YYTFIRLGITKERARLILLIFLPLYVILAGASPSVVRAVFMAWIVLFSLQLRFKVHPLDGLGLTFIICIIENPYIFYHVGFQLSYLVTASLLLSGNLLDKTKNIFISSFLITFIAQM